MIKSFNFSKLITTKNQLDCKKIIDFLFESSNWCKDVPTFQTWPNLYEYKEFDIFSQTLIKSCESYTNEKKNYKITKFWCYMDYSENYLKKNPDELWHSHGTGLNKLSAIYYLINPENTPTEFKDFFLTKVEPFTWYIFPSHYVHRPPNIINSGKRYTLAADIEII
jgi:hypothetical protein